MPKTPRFPDTVTEKLKKLPGQPGCYIYRDTKGEVLYVGKALVLKNRVRSYFQESTRHGLRIARMVSKVADLEWIVVDSEVEALVLECNLIKKYRPPFNVRLRDDKSYPYVKITNEKFPRVLFTRKLLKDGAKYFGPYTSAYGVRDTLALLHKIFPLIPCGKSWSGRREQSPCLYHHLGRCLAPCAGLSEPAVYKDVITQVARFLDGKEDSILRDLKAQMAKAAEELEFEKAAKLRDQVAQIEQLMERQKVLSGDKTDQDVIAVVKDERGAAIQMLYIRGGKLIGQRQFMLDGAIEATAGEAVENFVKQYYSDAPEVPREILLPVEIEERNIVQSWLRQKRGAAVAVEVPQGGEKLRLVEMAATNAEAALSTFSADLAQKAEWALDAMTQLKEALCLPSEPLRIEGYDISNIQGTAPVGSMVVVENGEAAKAEYRRFKVRYHPESPNDFAMMHEVLTRRLRAYVEGDPKFSRLPDLIMIDGGRGQLGAALKARDELGLTVPMVGLAKRLELIIVPDELVIPDRLRDVPGHVECAGEVDSRQSTVGSEPFAVHNASLAEVSERRGEANESFVVHNESLAVHNESLAVHNELLAVGNGLLAEGSEPFVDGPEPLVSHAERERLDHGLQAALTSTPQPPSSFSAGSPTPPGTLPGENEEGGYNPRNEEGGYTSRNQEGEKRSRQKGIDNPVLRMKDPDYSYDRAAPIQHGFHDVELPMNSPGLMLLRKLRDEAHRFALTYHRKIRDKRMAGSVIEEIPGVGPRRKRLLLRTFGSIAGIRRASVEEIAAVPTMTRGLAEQVAIYLKEDK